MDFNKKVIKLLKNIKFNNFSYTTLNQEKYFQKKTHHYLMNEQYSKGTIEGDKKTEWICGCFQTTDNYFKFCSMHNQTLQKAIQAQIDELDMTLVIEQKN